MQLRKMIIFAFSAFFSLNSSPAVPIIHPLAETSPLPVGIQTSDDPAIWVNLQTPEKSLILGVNKFKGDGINRGGLGVYNLLGEELKYLPVGRLGNIDIRDDLAVATNRETNGISIFQIHSQPTPHVEFLTDFPLILHQQKTEPYGLCLYKNKITQQLIIFVTLKSGVLLKYLVSNPKEHPKIELLGEIDLAHFVTSVQEERMKHLIYLDLESTEELDKLQDKIKRRFQIEACVADEDYGVVYVGMERLGIFQIAIEPTNTDPKLVAEVLQSKTTPREQFHHFRLTDDIEGLAIYREGSKKGLVVVSSQGISEFSVFDRETFRYRGNFTVGATSSIDEVTNTDGLEIVSAPLSPLYPKGLMVVHDDLNESNKKILNANYKIVSFSDVLQYFPLK